MLQCVIPICASFDVSLCEMSRDVTGGIIFQVNDDWVDRMEGRDD